jgi:hypothetical protein
VVTFAKRIENHFTSILLRPLKNRQQYRKVTEKHGCSRLGARSSAAFWHPYLLPWLLYPYLYYLLGPALDLRENSDRILQPTRFQKEGVVETKKLFRRFRPMSGYKRSRRNEKSVSTTRLNIKEVVETCSEGKKRNKWLYDNCEISTTQGSKKK